jgi:predicted small secreted protein
MNKTKSTILKVVAISLVIASLLTGCSTIKGIFGKSATAEQKSADKIELAKNEIAQNTSDQLYEIGGLSFGVGYSLNQSVNDDPAIKTAQVLNERVQSVAGLPNLEDQKSMQSLVTDLLNNTGDKALAAKDREISDLQSQKKDLESNKDKAIANYMSLAEKTALRTDTLSSQLSSYQSYWGLGAVAKGLWSFGTHIFWVLLIGGILYTALRIFAMTNPTAAVVFSIFSRIGSILIQLIEYVVPKSIDELELVSSEAYSALEKEYITLKNSIVAAAVTPITTTVATTVSPAPSPTVVTTTSNTAPIVGSSVSGSSH